MDGAAPRDTLATQPLLPVKARPTGLQQRRCIGAGLPKLLGAGGDLNPLTFNSKTSSREYYQQPVDVAQANLPLPTIMDRLRLRFTRDAMPAKPELLFEIEMYGKTGKIPPQ